MTDSTLTAVHHRTLKVMLVDDQRLARTGFSLMLAKTGTVDVIAEASDGQQAIQVLDSRYRSCDPSPTSYSWMSGCQLWTASRQPDASRSVIPA